MSDSDGGGGSTASSRKRANSSGGDRSSPSPPRHGAASYPPPGISATPAPAPAPTPTPASKKKQKKGSRGSHTGVQAFVPPVSTVSSSALSLSSSLVVVVFFPVCNERTSMLRARMFSFLFSAPWRHAAAVYKVAWPVFFRFFKV